jgi:hypothetical protein
MKNVDNMWMGRGKLANGLDQNSNGSYRSIQSINDLSMLHVLEEPDISTALDLSWGTDVPDDTSLPRTH